MFFFIFSKFEDYPIFLIFSVFVFVAFLDVWYFSCQQRLRCWRSRLNFSTSGRFGGSSGCRKTSRNWSQCKVRFITIYYTYQSNFKHFNSYDKTKCVWITGNYKVKISNIQRGSISDVHSNFQHTLSWILLKCFEQSVFPTFCSTMNQCVPKLYTIKIWSTIVEKLSWTKK